MALALEDSIGSYSKYQINRVTDDLIREALKKMKSKKSDALYDTMSDFYIHVPDELVSHLAAMIKLYFQHGCIPPFILLCTLLPIVKDNLGDATSPYFWRGKNLGVTAIIDYFDKQGKHVYGCAMVILYFKIHSPKNASMNKYNRIKLGRPRKFVSLFSLTQALGCFYQEVFSPVLYRIGCTLILPA